MFSFTTLAPFEVVIGCFKPLRMHYFVFYVMTGCYIYHPTCPNIGSSNVYVRRIFCRCFQWLSLIWKLKCTHLGMTTLSSCHYSIDILSIKPRIIIWLSFIRIDYYIKKPFFRPAPYILVKAALTLRQLKS